MVDCFLNEMITSSWIFLDAVARQIFVRPGSGVAAKSKVTDYSTLSLLINQ